MHQRPASWQSLRAPPKLSQDGTFILLPRSVRVPWRELEPLAERYCVTRKAGLYVTVFGSRHGRLLKPLCEGQRDHALRRLIARTDWSFESLPEYFLVRRRYPEEDNEERTAIIQLVRLPCLVSFCEEASRVTRLRLAPVLPHIALYTGSTSKARQYAGISLYSESEFRALRPERLLIQMPGDSP
jgi:hypothetical protein